MNRRHFLTVSTGAGVVAATGVDLSSAPGAANAREYYELRRYHFAQPAPESSNAGPLEEQKARFEKFMGAAAIPALNRLGIKPVGVFYPKEGLSTPAYVLLPHPSLESFASLTERLSEDSAFLEDGEDYIGATREKPVYQRIETSLLHAFDGMPKLETPVKSPGRVLQLRIYESPTEVTNLKKIEMFNEAGEIRIFREVGLHPVFFGRAIAGDKLPNLTYMLAFESEDQLKANWRKFGAHPDWQKLKTLAEYADKTILSGITNILLKPAACSQV